MGHISFTREQEWEWQERNVSTKEGKTTSLRSGKEILILREKMQNEASGTIALSYSWAWLYKRSFLNRNDLRFLEGIVHENILFRFQCCLYAKRVLMLDSKFLYRKNTGIITTSWNNTRAKSLFDDI